MTRQQAKAEVIALWLRKADESLAAARDDVAAERTIVAVTRIYYACFHALSALLLNDGRRFVKHRGVRAAMHEHLVRTGELARPLAEFYDRMFEARNEADYGESWTSQNEKLRADLHKAEQFVDEMKRLIVSRQA